MKTKLFRIMGLCLLFVILGIPAARAELISLDPIANAGWYADDLTKTHLYIKDPDSGDYYYEWSYVPGEDLPWDSLNNLVVDLNDGVLDITPSGITVDNWLIESGGDVFNDPGSEIWESMFLPQGSYELTLTSGAYNLEAYWGGDVWNAYTEIWADYGDGSGDSFSFGEGFPAFDSEAEALEYYDDYALNINLAQAADLYFYINDWNSVDNAGSSVTLDIKSTPVPEPASLLLVCSGLVGLASLRRKFKKG